ncbi:MAG: hypothetical protein ACRCXL_01360 [Dermatophilaceae bacterium]
MTIAQVRYLAEVWPSSVDKHSVEGEVSVRLCNYTDVYNNDTVAPHDQLMTATATADEIRRHRLRSGDSVLTKDSEDPCDIGISAFITDTAEDFVCGYHLAIARPKPGTHPRFLNWALRAQPALAHFSTHASGISRYGLGVGDLRSTPISIHELSAQRRIADFLDDRITRIDQIITARHSQHRALDATAQSELSTAALSGSETMPLRYLILDERLGIWGQEPGVEELEVRVARVADFQRTEFRLASVPTLRSAAANHVAPRALRHGDVLLERSGGTKINPVGCPAFVDSPAPATVCSNFVSRLRPTEDTDGRYLSLLLGAMYATRQQEPHSTQTTGIQNLDSGSYLRTRVPRRSLREQTDLANAMDSALGSARARQAQLQASIDLLSEYKQALITAAVTGERDVTTAGSGIPR